MKKKIKNEWMDEVFRIKTSGRDDTKSDMFNYPYEPTPYDVLERMAGSGYFGKKDVLVDYGSGKGRVDFFFAYQTKTKTIGIEYDERMYNLSMKNKEAQSAFVRCTFICEKAENYIVDKEVNRCYFFNPFSADILKKVMRRILDSYYENQREILLFFYYPSNEYISYLMTYGELEFFDEIDCSDIGDGLKNRERIMIFKIC